MSISETIRPYILALKSKEGWKALSGWCYRKLSSIWTSVYVLGAMALLFVIGTIFPQGEDFGEYIKAGGRFIDLVGIFGLLDLFTSPLFLILALLLLANLIVCSYERYAALLSGRVFPKGFEPTHILSLTHDIPDAHIEVRRLLRERLGFRLLSKDGDWIVMEKGLSYRWLTWLYHAGIIACFLGFMLTYLFAFEDSITLAPNEAQTVAPSTNGRLQGLFHPKHGPTDFHLLLEDFSTEYSESPELDFPKDKTSRLAIGLGWSKPGYEMKPESLSVKDWRSRIKVVQGGKTLLEKTIEINDPLRFGGYTFYQEGYEQRLKIRVYDNPIPLEVKTDEDAFIPGLDATLKFGTFRTGALHRLDGSVEKIKPFAFVKLKTGEEKYEDIGKIDLGGFLDINGSRVTLVDAAESSVLSYRYDPGVAVLWWSGIFVLVTMSLRFFGGWYRLAYAIDEADSIVMLKLNLNSKGLGADPSRIVRRLERYLTMDDIRPFPLPPE
ncbi:MAG: cytochrome c biogenesis protein ResB [Deltaproteobacteria bacterium]|nr:cytochrome c biogenesis protein ResB [Deltaproteobacteria bacterium]